MIFHKAGKFYVKFLIIILNYLHHELTRNEDIIYHQHTCETVIIWPSRQRLVDDMGDDRIDCKAVWICDQSELITFVETEDRYLYMRELILI